MNRHLLGKHLDVYHKTQKFSYNPSDILKNKCHFKLIFGHAAFQLLSELTFPLKFSLLLNNSIR